ncbi:hypothetical protein COY27_06060 [Candidatus Woesearchaeota archaeon CG_4_10_14_0_2_um_filter_33_13]|nr:MAG: hypothetical protein COY27_06060 [Candidatus Woesearchaeota archaeon CG_4_10_14_0_2_um_filter_33_13]
MWSETRDLDFATIDIIFEQAASEKRNVLFEHEVYRIMQIAGINTPRFELITQPQQRTEMQGKVVVKVSHPHILHKSDVGGVKITHTDSLEETVRRMQDDVPRAFARHLIKHPQQAPAPYQQFLRDGDRLTTEIANDLQGVLVVEYVPFTSNAYGTELLMGIKNDDAFGPILLFGPGGTATEFLSQHLHGSTSISSAFLGDELERIQRTTTYQLVSGKVRGVSHKVEDSELSRVTKLFTELARHYSHLSPEARWNIDELEINPFAVGERLTPLDGLLRFSTIHHHDVQRPVHKIGNLLNPKRVGFIGVSGNGPNIGRGIVENLIHSGFREDNIYIVHPRATEISGCKCYSSVEELRVALGNKKLDTFVVATPAPVAVRNIEEVLNADLTESFIVVTSGFGESSGTATYGEQLKTLLTDSRVTESKGALLVGPNCVGIRTTDVDLTFVPAIKNSPTGKPFNNLALYAQSGGFGVSLTSDFNGLAAFNVTNGNQIDVSVSEFLHYFTEQQQIHTCAFYIEAFQECDGLRFAQEARHAIKNGKEVIVLKGGRTKDGADATAGHTASTAGAYSVLEAVLEQAGVYIAESIEEFRTIAKLSSLFDGKDYSTKDRKPQVVGMNNAGYGKVSIADALEKARLQSASCTEETLAKLRAVYESKGVLDYIDLSAVLDLTAACDDKMYDDICRPLLEDDNVDGLIIGLTPNTTKMQTITLPELLLPDGRSHDIRADDAFGPIVAKLARDYNKPFVVSIDGGSEYDPLRQLLQNEGIPVFKNDDKAAIMLGHYLNYRDRIAELR